MTDGRVLRRIASAFSDRRWGAAEPDCAKRAHVSLDALEVGHLGTDGRAMVLDALLGVGTAVPAVGRCRDRGHRHRRQTQGEAQAKQGESLHDITFHS